MKQSHSIIFGTAAAALLALGAGTLPAHAQLKGCTTDPILTLSNGLSERIIVTAPRGATVRLDVTLPRGVRVVHTWSDGLLRERIVLHAGMRYHVDGQIWDSRTPLKPRVTLEGTQWNIARPLTLRPDGVGIGSDSVGFDGHHWH